MRQNFQTQPCEYCGCYYPTVLHYDVTLMRKPERKTISGTTFYTDGVATYKYQIQLCQCCAHAVTQEVFRKILQVPDGTVIYKRIKPRRKSYA